MRPLIPAQQVLARTIHRAPRTAGEVCISVARTEPNPAILPLAPSPLTDEPIASCRQMIAAPPPPWTD